MVNFLSLGTDNGLKCCGCQKACTGMHTCIGCNMPCHVTCGVTIGEGCASMVLCSLCGKLESQQINRVAAVEGLHRQGNRMLARTDSMFAPIPVGTNVRIAIPDQDRWKMGPRNIVCVVMKVEEDFYTVGCRNGILKRSFIRADLEVVDACFLAVEAVPENYTTLRQCGIGYDADDVNIGSNFLQPSFCKCTKRCTTRSCPCRKQNQQVRKQMS